jgi:hypothetical protein
VLVVPNVSASPHAAGTELGRRVDLARAARRALQPRR